MQQNELPHILCRCRKQLLGVSDRDGLLAPPFCAFRSDAPNSTANQQYFVEYQVHYYYSFEYFLCHKPCYLVLKAIAANIIVIYLRIVNMVLFWTFKSKVTCICISRIGVEEAKNSAIVEYGFHQPYQ
jgi:hypothetical protein